MLALLLRSSAVIFAALASPPFYAVSLDTGSAEAENYRYESTPTACDRDLLQSGALGADLGFRNRRRKQVMDGHNQLAI